MRGLLHSHKKGGKNWEKEILQQGEKYWEQDTGKKLVVKAAAAVAWCNRTQAAVTPSIKLLSSRQAVNSLGSICWPANLGAAGSPSPFFYPSPKYHLLYNHIYIYYSFTTGNQPKVNHQTPKEERKKEAAAVFTESDGERSNLTGKYESRKKGVTFTSGVTSTRRKNHGQLKTLKCEQEISKS